MKKLSAITLLSVASLILTGCFDKTISKEKFEENLNDVKTHLTWENEDITDVHINSRLNIEVYNYKEGEFFSYKYFAIALIVPISYGDYTWKDGDNYYHYHDDVIDSHDKLTVLSEESFNTYMAQHKATLISVLSKPVNACEDLMSEQPTLYDNVTCKYQQTSKKVFRLNATGSYETQDSSNPEQMVTKTAKVTIDFKDRLPIKYKYTTKTDSEDTWKYEYGSAAFAAPVNPDEQ